MPFYIAIPDSFAQCTSEGYFLLGVIDTLLIRIRTKYHFHGSRGVKRDQHRKPCHGCTESVAKCLLTLPPLIIGTGIVEIGLGVLWTAGFRISATFGLTRDRSGFPTYSVFRGMGDAEMIPYVSTNIRIAVVWMMWGKQRSFHHVIQLEPLELNVNCKSLVIQLIKKSKRRMVSMPNL